MTRFLSSRHVRMQHAHQFPSIMLNATNKQYSTIQSRMHLHDTVSAPVANGTLKNICPEHFLLLIFQKLPCIPEPTGKPTCVILHRGSISISFSFLPFSFYHSITIWHHFHHIITEHGALLTGHGSWMASSVNVVPSATPQNIPIRLSPKVRGYDV